MVSDEVALRRVVSLPLLVLYGVGTIVGAGFYALLGEVCDLAGSATPTAIVLAALVALFSALSFADLAGRYPQSGGPVRYVEVAFGRPALARLVGVAMILTGVVSAATLSRAVGRFMEELYGLPPALPIVVTVVGLGAIAALGVRLSGLVAAAITLLEVGGLVAVLVARLDVLPELPARAFELAPGSAAPWSGVLAGTFLVFYAFVGFEDMVTLAEEVKDPHRNLPRGILVALGATTLLYVAVAVVAVLAVAPGELAASKAPMALLIGERGAAARGAIVWIGALAGLNGALVQLVMSARVVHGMRMPRGVLAWLGAVHPRTRTPLRATAISTAVVLAMALTLPLVTLASWTSAILLVVFTAVHAAMLVVGTREPRRSGFRCPRWVAALGLVLCLAMLSLQVARALGA